MQTQMNEHINLVNADNSLHVQRYVCAIFEVGRGTLKSHRHTRWSSEPDNSCPSASGFQHRPYLLQPKSGKEDPPGLHDPFCPAASGWVGAIRLASVTLPPTRRRAERIV